MRKNLFDILVMQKKIFKSYFDEKTKTDNLRMSKK